MNDWTRVSEVDRRPASRHSADCSGFWLHAERVEAEARRHGELAVGALLPGARNILGAAGRGSVPLLLAEDLGQTLELLLGQAPGISLARRISQGVAARHADGLHVVVPLVRRRAWRVAEHPGRAEGDQEEQDQARCPEASQAARVLAAPLSTARFPPPPVRRRARVT